MRFKYNCFFRYNTDIKATRLIIASAIIITPYTADVHIIANIHTTAVYANGLFIQSPPFLIYYLASINDSLKTYSFSRFIFSRKVLELFPFINIFTESILSSPHNELTIEYNDTSPDTFTISVKNTELKLT